MAVLASFATSCVALCTPLSNLLKSKTLLLVPTAGLVAVILTLVINAPGLAGAVYNGVSATALLWLGIAAIWLWLTAIKPTANFTADVNARQLWKEKLAHFLREEALVSGADQKFELAKRIQEARRKIDELDRESRPSCLRGLETQRRFVSRRAHRPR